MLCLGEGGELIKTDYYILYNSIQDHHEAIERAYQLIRDNYDIVEDWFSTVGRPGNKFAKHFDCRTRTRFKGKKFKMWGRGVPTGMELGLKYLENLENARGTASPDECVCLDIDLAAVILHETLHLCWRGGERTAWSMDAWWRVKITNQLALTGVTYCFVTQFPADGKWNDRLKDIRPRVPAAVGPT